MRHTITVGLVTGLVLLATLLFAITKKLTFPVHDVAEAHDFGYQIVDYNQKHYYTNQFILDPNTACIVFTDQVRRRTLICGYYQVTIENLTKTGLDQ